MSRSFLIDRNAVVGSRSTKRRGKQLINGASGGFEIGIRESKRIHLDLYMFSTSTDLPAVVILPVMGKLLFGTP